MPATAGTPPPDSSAGMALVLAVIAVTASVGALALSLVRRKGPPPSVK